MRIQLTTTRQTGEVDTYLSKDLDDLFYNRLIVEIMTTSAGKQDSVRFPTNDGICYFSQGWLKNCVVFHKQP